jgi:hypothetical protein
MSVMRMSWWLLFLALLAGSCFGYAQSALNGSDHSPRAAQLKAQGSSGAQKPNKLSPKVAAVNSPTKLQLMSISAVSLKALAESLPVAGQSGGQKSPRGNVKAATKASSEDSGVSEFEAVSGDSGGSGGMLAIPSSGSRKSALKDIHGEVDGALGQGSVGANQIGGAVGATSKSGKTSIFLQTNHTTVQEPR